LSVILIRLEKITIDNFEDCLRLTVNDEQKEFIASNAYSLAEAYALCNHHSYVPLPLAIYARDMMVGFAFVIYEPKDDDDPDDEDVYYLARFMIGKKYQNNGYGRSALNKLLEFLQTHPIGKAKSIVLSCNPNNHKAYSLFLSAGFKEMGFQDDDGDNLLQLELN